MNVGGIIVVLVLVGGIAMTVSKNLSRKKEKQQNDEEQ